MITFSVISLITALVVALMWAFIMNERTDAALKKTKDLLLSMTSGKKMIIKRSYLRKEELEYLKKLEDILPEKYIIKTQIHLSDIADVQVGYYDHDNLFYELKRIILDYVIFDQQYNPLVGIELNGSSHKYDSRKNRDAFTKNLLLNIGVEYLEIDLLNKPLKKDIYGKLEAKLNLAENKQVFPRAYVSPNQT